MPIRVGVVYGGGYSDVCRVQMIWRKGMPYGREQRIGDDFK